MWILLYIVMDNQIYGLTTGPDVATSRVGMKTKSMPFGTSRPRFNPISLALAAGATSSPRVQRRAESTLRNSSSKESSIRASPSWMFSARASPTINDNTYQWFRPRVKKLEDDSAHDPTNWMAAMEKSLLWGDEIPIGKFLRAHRRFHVARSRACL